MEYNGADVGDGNFRSIQWLFAREERVAQSLVRRLHRSFQVSKHFERQTLRYMNILSRALYVNPLLSLNYYLC